MKIREDFVTNSSSSSYIIAFKDLPEIDKETLEKYSFLKPYKEVLNEVIFESSGSYETTDGEIFENLENLRDYLMEEYGYYNESFEELLKEDEYVSSLYKDCAEKIGEGYKILIKEVGYGDFREGLFHDLQSDDFIIIEGE